MANTNYEYDYRKLRGRIVEKCGTQKDFAALMGWSLSTISLKLTGRVQWKQSEISLACYILCISDCDIGGYFFAQKV